MSADRLLPLSSARAVALPPSQEHERLLTERRALLGAVLQTLTPREAGVLRRRFGLDDGEEQSLRQVGAAYQLTTERIRQIEAKALRKMRHPTRSKALYPLIDV